MADTNILNAIEQIEDNIATAYEVLEDQFNVTRDGDDTPSAELGDTISKISIPTKYSDLTEDRYYLPLTAGNGKPLTGTLYAQDIYPKTDNTYYLGSDTYGYLGIYLSQCHITSWGNFWCDNSGANTSFQSGLTGSNAYFSIINKTISSTTEAQVGVASLSVSAGDTVTQGYSLAEGFKVHGSSDSYVCLAGGGTALLSSIGGTDTTWTNKNGTDSSYSLALYSGSSNSIFYDSSGTTYNPSTNKFNTITAEDVWSSNSSGESDCGCLKTTSNAGSIYLYSQYSTTGYRGIYGVNSAGTSSAILSVDSSNNVTLFGNASTATKATQDGNGNTITSTYLPLAGGNFTASEVHLGYNSSYSDPWSSQTVGFKFGGSICCTAAYFNGTVTSSGNYYANSDIRYKNIIEDLDISSLQISQLPIFKFSWTNREDDKIHVGSSAQAVEEIIPELVTEDNIKSLDYATLGAVGSIVACREIENLKNTISCLLDKIEKLEEKLNGIPNIN